MDRKLYQQRLEAMDISLKELDRTTLLAWAKERIQHWEEHGRFRVPKEEEHFYADFGQPQAVCVARSVLRLVQEQLPQHITNNQLP